jgi:5-methylcytosine-specific restriction endonuclease McrA
MSNRWNITGWLEREVRERDKVCIYCGVDFAMPRGKVGSKPSWEHIVNDASIVTRDNIALCCRSCNASKGQKTLTDWLQTQYCIDRGISAKSVAPVAKAALNKER